jgi:hypothetical protein
VTRNNQDCFSSRICKQQPSKWLYRVFVTPAALEQGGFCIDEVYVHKKKLPFISMPFINFSAFHSNTRSNAGVNVYELTVDNDGKGKLLLRIAWP